MAVTFGLWNFAPSGPLVQAILGVGITVPFLLLLWLARRMCYIVQRPAVAVVGSGFYLVLLFACLYASTRAGRLTALTAFLCMGLASLVASGVLFWSLGLLQSGNLESPGEAWRGALAENWKYGRWLVGSTVLYSALSQTQTFLVAAWLGLGAAGVLRAMQLPGFVMSQVVVATGLLFLPVSSDFGRGAIRRMRQKAMLVSVGLTIAALVFAFALQLFANPVEHLFYGGKYAAYAWLMPLLALVPAANAFSTGYSMALRSSQQPHFDLISNAAVAPVALLGAFFLIYKWGLVGAAFSMVLSFVLLSAMTFACFQWFSRGSTSGVRRDSMFGNPSIESVPAPIRQPAQEDTNGY
jgi:O-antigen/teichoic acid export membrane protein